LKNWQWKVGLVVVHQQEKLMYKELKHYFIL